MAEITPGNSECDSRYLTTIFSLQQGGVRGEVAPEQSDATRAGHPANRHTPQQYQRRQQRIEIGLRSILRHRLGLFELAMALSRSLIASSSANFPRRAISRLAGALSPASIAPPDRSARPRRRRLRNVSSRRPSRLSRRLDAGAAATRGRPDRRLRVNRRGARRTLGQAMATSAAPRIDASGIPPDRSPPLPPAARSTSARCSSSAIASPSDRPMRNTACPCRPSAAPSLHLRACWSRIPPAASASASTLAPQHADGPPWPGRLLELPGVDRIGLLAIRHAAGTGRTSPAPISRRRRSFSAVQSVLDQRMLLMERRQRRVGPVSDERRASRRRQPAPRQASRSAGAYLKPNWPDHRRRRGP